MYESNLSNARLAVVESPKNNLYHWEFIDAFCTERLSPCFYDLNECLSYGIERGYKRAKSLYNNYLILDTTGHIIKEIK